MLDEEVDEHHDGDERERQRVERADDHEVELEAADAVDVLRERAAHLEVAVEHRVEDAEVEVPLESLRQEVEARERRRPPQRQQVAVDEGDHEVLLAQDAVGDVVRRQLLLHDAQPRAVVQLDDPLHHRVPRDVVELVVVDLQPVAVEVAHLEERPQVLYEVAERPQPVAREDRQHVQPDERRAAHRRPHHRHARVVRARLLVAAVVHQPLEVEQLEEEDGQRDREREREQRDDPRREDAPQPALVEVLVHAAEEGVEVGDRLPPLLRAVAAHQRDRVHLHLHLVLVLEQRRRRGLGGRHFCGRFTSDW